MTKLNEIRLTIASEINAHHQAATSKANEAINHAKDAGDLLLEVKKALPHGQFSQWMDENIQVSTRQAQRYMAVAQGKPVPIRELATKNDTVSYLTPPSMLDGDTPAPSFIPLKGHWYWCASNGGAMDFVIEQSTSEGYFFVSRIDDDGDTYSITRRPIRYDAIELMLQLWGLKEPSKASWHVRPSKGVRVAMETLSDEETIQASIKDNEDFRLAKGKYSYFRA
ncbi:hypothetical protein AAKU61_000004 [Undibacterium sp. GrIS 1.2]|uniref:DUF3102 domain-containing protein n=1 Tax=Undibacterium sp. GrIS 1.2 TaxID=3143933 RepID=UPI0033939A4E